MTAPGDAPEETGLHAADVGTGTNKRRPLRKRRRAPTRLAVLASVLSHVVTLIVVAFSISALSATTACTVIAIVSFFAAASRLAVGALRFPKQEVDIGWMTFQVGFLFWFALPGFARATLGDWYFEAALVHANESSFSWGLAGVALFAASFDAAYAVVRPGRKTREFGAAILGDSVSYEPHRYVVPLFVGALVVLAMYIGVSGGVGALYANLVQLRSGLSSWTSDGNYSTSLSTWHAVSESIVIIIAAVSGDIALNKRVRGRRRLMLFGLWIACAVFVALASGGTRSSLVLCVCPAATLYVRSRLVLGLGTRRIVLLTLAACTLFWVSSLLRLVRESGFDAQADVSASSVYSEDADALAHAALSFEVFDLVGERANKESALWNILCSPIPRWIWPSKPESKVIIDYSYFYWDLDVSTRGGTVTPSVVGQFLLSWGWFGIFEIGLAWGLMVSLGDAAIRDVWGSWAPIAWALVAWWMFMAFRFVGPTFFPPAYMLLLVVLARRMLGSLTRVHRGLGPSLQAAQK
jgi:hypothetical protein